MNTSKLIELLRTGREIEFSYAEKNYSVLPAIENGTAIIHFCEAYQPEQVFASPEDFLDMATIDDEKLVDIWKWITDIVVY